MTILPRIMAALTALTLAASPTVNAAESVDFNLDILPILADRCFHCHGPDTSKVKGDLRLDIEERAKEFAISPGDIADSELITRITHDDPDEYMPPPKSGKPRLTAEEIDLFKRWIAEGAEWESHWAWEAPERPDAPEGPSAIDHFINERLEAEGLTPTSDASRETLIRRAAFDITGLPPTLEEIDAFVNDDSPDAYETMLDRYFASPHYGERMAIDWLDGARYADSNGFQNDFGRDMHPWRDWVINAYNENLPFDQFAIEQLAGDLLENATESQKIATGFNRNHRSNTEGGSVEEEWYVENRVDRIETTSTVFLGLTMGCARCHDHKYDPISQKDFYRFFAFFNSTADRGFYEETRGNVGPQITLHTDDSRERLAKFDADIAEAQAKLTENEKEIRSQYAPIFRDIKNHTAAAPNADATIHLALDPEAPPAEANETLQQSEEFRPEHDKPFSASIWIYRTGGSGAIFSKIDDAAAYRGFDLFLLGDGKLQTHLINTWPENGIRMATDAALRDNGWSHVTMTYDGSGKATGVQLYINSVPVNAKADTDTLDGSIHTNQPLRIGQRSNSEHLQAKFADFRIYEEVLDQSEIEAIMAYDFAQRVPEDLTAELRQELSAIRNATQTLALGDARNEVDKLNREKDDYIKENVPTVMVMEEMETPRETYLLMRGAYDAPDTSEQLFPDVPGFLPELGPDLPKNRLGLAKWIASEDNPLTARVTVNRLWQKFFGTGLVKTAENFGTQAAPPAYPRLLDWLATEFIRLDWDLKAIQKTIMMTDAYRRDSDATAELLERDPQNTLLARGPRFRMQAELIRDNALAISGLLTDEVGGPAAKPYQPEGLWEELAGGANQGPYTRDTGDDLYRRSLYTNRKRTVPHTTLTTFDAPSFEVCTVRRARTNTPLQALALLNDTTYVEAARKLAERMIIEGGEDSASRVAYGFRLATGRLPNDRERNILTRGLEGYHQSFNEERAKAFTAVGESDTIDSVPPVELAAYSAVATVLLNLDETITKE